MSAFNLNFKTMDKTAFSATLLQEKACEYIASQEWVCGILANMLEAAESEGRTSGRIYEKDHPELKETGNLIKLKFFLRQRGFLVTEYAGGGNPYLEVDWNFTQTTKKFFDIWDANEEFMTTIYDAMEGLQNISDIIGAGIVAWMNGRNSSTCDKAEQYITEHIAAVL